MIRVGLIGARGYVGRELISELDQDERFDLAFASSRAMEGRRLSTLPGLMGLTRFGDYVADQVSPEELSSKRADVVVLGMPNGAAEPFVQALNVLPTPPVVIDLSADYRHKDGWSYGAFDMAQGAIVKARWIANPGCYATAMNVGLWPLRDLTDGVVAASGISGFSGAGTTPGQTNDPERLQNNVLPYKFGGHGHEAEVEGFTGLSVAFTPHVAGFFRGLIVTMTVPLSQSMTADEVQQLFEETYAGAPMVEVTAPLPEVSAVAGRDVCQVGGFALSKQGRVLTFSSALDNLRKGAATQALDNIKLAMGLAAP
ncbi:MAG: N-acetyl-gamma-glutamyl-phosphate reductase [Parvularculaceae bacterium]|nr:N-acetyl-gamma-glutamyl-phosphate reductase [Parvularculaceae bacterium]